MFFALCSSKAATYCSVGRFVVDDISRKFRHAENVVPVISYSLKGRFILCTLDIMDVRYTLATTKWMESVVGPFMSTTDVHTMDV